MLKGAVDNQSNVLICFSLTLAYIYIHTYVHVRVGKSRQEEAAAAERKEAKQTETITKRAAPSPQSRAEQQQQRAQPAVSLCVSFPKRSYFVPLTRRRGGQSLNALLQGLGLHTPTTFGAGCGL